ncbi:MAG: hypothetical protein P0S94_03740 [Simkaniaceae bacterium]|nr:hypothetical protein [Simkaniaceae bacterium]
MATGTNFSVTCPTRTDDYTVKFTQGASGDEFYVLRGDDQVQVPRANITGWPSQRPERSFFDNAVISVTEANGSYNVQIASVEPGSRAVATSSNRTIETSVGQLFDFVETECTVETAANYFGIEEQLMRDMGADQSIVPGGLQYRAALKSYRNDIAPELTVLLETGGKVKKTAFAKLKNRLGKAIERKDSNQLLTSTRTFIEAIDALSARFQRMHTDVKSIGAAISIYVDSILTFTAAVNGKINELERVKNGVTDTKTQQLRDKDSKREALEAQKAALVETRSAIEEKEKEIRRQRDVILGLRKDINNLEATIKSKEGRVKLEKEMLRYLGRQSDQLQASIMQKKSDIRLSEEICAEAVRAKSSVGGRNRDAEYQRTKNTFLQRGLRFLGSIVDVDVDAREKAEQAINKSADGQEIEYLKGLIERKTKEIETEQGELVKKKEEVDEQVNKIDTQQDNLDNAQATLHQLRADDKTLALKLGEADKGLKSLEGKQQALEGIKKKLELEISKLTQEIYEIGSRILKLEQQLTREERLQVQLTFIKPNAVFVRGVKEFDDTFNSMMNTFFIRVKGILNEINAGAQEMSDTPGNIVNEIDWDDIEFQLTLVEESVDDFVRQCNEKVLEVRPNLRATQFSMLTE